MGITVLYQANCISCTMLDTGIRWPLVERKVGPLASVKAGASCSFMSGCQAYLSRLSSAKHTSDYISQVPMLCHHKVTCSRSGQPSRPPLWVPIPCSMRATSRITLGLFKFPDLTKHLYLEGGPS